MITQTILFASTNTGKFREFQRLINLDPALFNVISLHDLGYTIPPCEETGTTFEENALLKVNHTRAHLKSVHKDVVVIGDDSGMSITALGGEPGVFTRRWKGYEMTDEEIISHCLQLLSQHPDRTAEYVTVLAVGTSLQQKPHIIKGVTKGIILDSPRQDSYVEGIPFRSLFYIPQANMMFHDARELPTKKRNDWRIGHEDALQECRSFFVDYTDSLLKLQKISEALQKAWTRETSYNPQDWSKDNASVGQCAVSSLIIQDLLGGKLIRCIAQTKDNRVTHFFNKLPDGQEWDSTRDQFSADTLILDPVAIDRERVLSHAGTVERYSQLRARFLKHFG